jgi:hypothetical protein
MPSMHQSAHHVRAYKAPTPALRCAQDLKLMAGAATYLHGRCIEAAVGEWQAVTFVPSTTRPGGNPPIADIARTVHDVYPSRAKVGLAVGPGARCVTVLCVTRWLRYDWADHRELIETLTEPYDAARCPVTGSSCAPY